MTPREWKEAWEIYQAASDLTGPDRDSYLHKALVDNAAIREDVLRLLAETPERAVDDAVPDADPAAIGPYRLLKIIGEGGMGTVYLAEQERPLRRKVALKLIRRGLHSREVLARFEIERRALAILDHPNIAHVFDAGTTSPHGHPYFVMEFVDGLPITLYCEKHALSVHERLKLVRQVCEAIQHAHSRAIIHRDIKPANVLVSEQDGKPIPRVIDFGVAKAIGTTSAEETLATSFGSVVGTLRYMSPEQASRNPDLDARTDIYSVGVLLYELITGTTPLDGEGQESASLPLALQRIAEVEPLPPSRRLRESAASNRLVHEVEGEVDWIVMKALEKDRARRYQTANALALDIGRYLDGEPVDAGPPSRSYRLAKLATRYRSWLAAAAAFMLLLIAATIVSVRQAFHARRSEQMAVEQRDRARLAEANARAERDRALAAEAQIRQAQEQTLAEKSRADRQAETARAISEFLQNDLLAQASPNVQAGGAKAPNPNLTVRAALDRSAAALAGKFQNQPAVKASIEHTIANSYLDLGLFPQAREHALQAVTLRRTILGPWHADTVASMDQLAVAYRNEGQFNVAEKIWAEIYQHQRKTRGKSDPATLQSMHSLGLIYRSQGKYKQSAEMYEQTLKLRRRILGPEDPETMRTANNLGYVYLFMSKSSQAEAMLAETLKMRRRMLGDEHPDTLITMSNLALAYEGLGRVEEAKALLEDTLTIQKRRLGPAHASTLATMLSLGRVFRAMHSLSDAEKVYSEGLEIYRRAGQEQDPTALTMMNNLGNVYLALGQSARAEDILSRALAMRRQGAGPNHPETLRTMLNLGNVYRKEGRYQPAEELMRQVVEARRQILGANDPNTLYAQARLVDLYLDTGRHAEAAELSRQVWEVSRRVLGEENESTVDALVQRARAASGQGDDAEARTLGGRALEIRRRVHGNEHPGTLEVVEMLALHSLRAGRAAEAEKSLAECLAARLRTQGEGDPATLQTMQNLASALERLGEPERAETLRRRALGTALPK